MSDRIARYAVAQSVSEVAIGSLVHSFHIPLGGHLLSLNQSLLLTFALKGAKNRRDGVSTSCGISNASAILKALSPVGKRLTPMLAISVQGTLYSLGVATLGLNLLGAVAGSMALSLWGFVQPLLIAYLIFGTAFFEALGKLWAETLGAIGVPVEAGFWALGALVFAKSFAASFIAIVAWNSGQSFEDRYLSELDRFCQKSALPTASMTSPLRGALRDLLRPAFLLSLLLGVGFFALKGEWVQTALYGLRAVAGGLFFFWLVRAFPKRWLLRFCANYPGLEEVLLRR